jgi:hypothetical protein
MHGAGLSNLIWLNYKKRAAVLEIFPYNFQKRTYKSLAGIIGVKHFSMKTMSPQNFRESNWSKEFLIKKDKKNYYRNLDTIVDLEIFKRYVEAIVTYQRILPV